MAKNIKSIKIIVGLGNPGQKYENTYHNVGSLFIEYLKNNPLLTTKYKIQNTNSFMNNSGPAIQKILKYFKNKPEEILIIHDDSDIELGKYKLSFNRGSAGHKGIESIIRTLKTKRFWRLRIGIRPKQESVTRLSARQVKNQESGKRTKAGLFVLKKITLRHKKILNEVFKQVEERLFVLFKIQRKTQTKTH